MSGREVSEELARQVRTTTGEQDVEEAVWHLLYQDRRRGGPDGGMD